MKKIMQKRRRIILFIMIFASFFFVRHFQIHQEVHFIPDYLPIRLDENTDDTTIFLQTGLKSSVIKDKTTLPNWQEYFFRTPNIECTALFKGLTYEERIKKSEGVPFADLQPGDILITLSTHSFGWQHGHAGLALDEDTVLECVSLGTESKMVKASHWMTYSNYAVLRLKDITPELQQKVVSYAKEALLGRPYSLITGLVGEKEPSEDNDFGFYCFYLIWYAWKQFGYDLDSDGGRIVTSNDILNSDYLEVVQLYGMDPRKFIKLGL